jgi:hypothetical protein
VLSLHSDFEDFTTFRPGEHHAASLAGLLDQLVAWSQALAPLRTESELAS